MSDHLPKVICEDCAFKVDELFNFREKVLQTEDMFMQMLKDMTKPDTNSMDNIVISGIHENVNRLTNDIQNSNDMSSNHVQNDIHTLSVIDNIGITDREQSVSHEEMSREGDMEVHGFHLDGDTVRMVDEQIREV